MSGLNTQLLSGLPLGAGDSIRGIAGTASAITFTLFGAEVTVANGVFYNHVLAQGVLGVADGLMYTPPTGNQAVVTQIVLVNTTASPVAGVKLGVDGPSTTAANQLLSGLTIPANGSAVYLNGELRVYDSGGNLYQTSTSTSFDATLPAVTVPATLTGIAGTAVTAARRDHQHQSPGGIASIVAASAGIVDTQVQVVGATIPAAFLRVGTVLRFRAFAFITSTVDNVVTFAIRLGPTTLIGNIPASLAAHCGNSGTVTAAGVAIECMLTIRTIGASGTCYATGFTISAATGAAVTQALANSTDLFTPASVAVDTTGANIAELTCVTAANTTTVTFQSASIEVVKM